MSIADKTASVSANNTTISTNNTTIAENEQKVYDSGVAQGEGNIWDEIQGVGGTRTDYDCFFRYWEGDYIRPKYKVVPKRGGGSISQHCRFVFLESNVKKIESKYFDFSNMTFDVSSGSTKCLYALFRASPQLEEIEDIGLNAGGYYFTYWSCPKLHTIAVMRCVKEGTYNAPFSNCTALANITIEGEIGNNIAFQHSSLLTIDSLKSIINALFDYSGTENEYTYTLTLNSGCLATLESEGATAEYNGTACTWIELIDNKKWNLVT